MLTIKNDHVESVRFNWEAADGKVSKLKMCQFTVMDQFKLNEIQKAIVDDTELDDTEKSALLMVSRVLVSVKTLKGDYFFDCTPKEFHDNYGSNAVLLLSQECTKLNPINIGGETLEDRKK